MQNYKLMYPINSNIRCGLYFFFSQKLRALIECGLYSSATFIQKKKNFD